MAKMPLSSHELLLLPPASLQSTRSSCLCVIMCMPERPSEIPAETQANAKLDQDVCL